MIVVRDLVKRYGAREAISGLSFTVGRGEIVGFLGPNGAGKSSTLRIVAGYLGPTSGTVEVCGHDVVTAGLAARSCVGYMPEMVPLYPEMRVIEYLGFRAELKGVARRARAGRVDDVMQKARVTDVAHVVIGNLSKGYRQRVGLADALVADPPLLVLDEPTAGLDPNQIRDVREVVAGLRGTHTVLLSTHILSEVEASCDRAIVIAKGKLVAEGTLDELGRARASTGVRLVCSGELEAARRALVKVEDTLPEEASEPTVSREGELLRVDVTWGSHVDVDTARVHAALAKAMVDEGLGLVELGAARGRLEDVFAELTTAKEPEPASSPKGAP